MRCFPSLHDTSPVLPRICSRMHFHNHSARTAFSRWQSISFASDHVLSSIKAFFILYSALTYLRIGYETFGSLSSLTTNSPCKVRFASHYRKLVTNKLKINKPGKQMPYIRLFGHPPHPAHAGFSAAFTSSAYSPIGLFNMQIACEEIPSPFPVNPSPSSVVAFTFT